MLIRQLTLLAVCFLLIVTAGCQSWPERLGTTRPGTAYKDYSYGYWLNGWRKSPEDTSPDVLCFETGYYGFQLDMDDLSKPRFGLIDDKADYQEALAADGKRLAHLQPAELAITLSVDGKEYTAVTCKAGTDTGIKRLATTRLWESGRYAQHFDLQNLVFKDATGNQLTCYADLDLVAWPESLTVSAELAPDMVNVDGPGLGVVGNGLCVVEKPLTIPHSPELDPDVLTVECWVNLPPQSSTSSGWLLCKNENEWEEGNYGFSLRGGAVTAVMNIGGGRENFTMLKQRGKLTPGTWHLLALSYDGTTMRFYVDGSLQGENPFNKTRVPGSGDLRIGQRADGVWGDGPAPIASALYDQVRIWSRALSADELRAHAKQPATLQSRDALAWEKTFEEGPAIKPPVWQDATIDIQLKTAANDWHVARQIPGPWHSGEKQKLTLNCDLAGSLNPKSDITVRVSTAEKQTFPAVFDSTFNARVAVVKDLQRSRELAPGNKGYYDFFLEIENTGITDQRVPFLMDFRQPAGITGILPMLCDEEGVPTGIPVQLSKNWHHGAYLRAYAMLPAPAGHSRYLLRVVYGFYGTVPSASHAQLSLVGWGANGRWDQLAIGEWGETICFDMDMSPTDVAITDVRALMLRNGLEGKKWNWTDAGWGGDWLGVNDASGHKLAFTGIKTAYLAHGPCLSDVRYDGFYGGRRQVDLKAAVQTLRTDDHARTFQQLEYRFEQSLSADGSWLFKMGRTGGYAVPKIAYGNREGLIAEHQIPTDLAPGETIVDRLTLTGEGPWWVVFPGAYFTNGKDWGTGYRALVIRSYEAVFNGKTYSNPTISLPVYQPGKDKHPPSVDFLLVPDTAVTVFTPGDTVSLDAELITLPRIADDYYGPNEIFRKHVADNPSSWTTTYREAIGNDLKLTVTGGTVTHRYPIIIRAESPEINVDIKGGVGYVPIRFEGLKTAQGYALYELVNGEEKKLDQAVKGNDFWQTDYDAGSNSYKMTFNLPVDGKSTSTWLLARKPRLNE